jgi:hypothetical protein
MADEDVWSRFFAPTDALMRLGFQGQYEHVATRPYSGKRPSISFEVPTAAAVGTFSIAAAQLTGGVVQLFPHEPN